MKYFKLLSSIIILIVTIFVFLSATYGWYVTNKNTDATGIEAKTNDEVMKYSIEIYDGSHYVSNKNTISNAFPGDVSYFRIKIVGADLIPSDYSYTINFECLSSIIEDTIQVSDSYVTYDSVELYKIENNKVLINDKTLYNISESNISLEDYKIENVYKFYSNVKNGDTLPSTNNDLVDSITIESTTIKDENDSYYYYFALEFNESSSIVTYNSSETSNPYMFQKLTIKSIKIERL